MSTRSVIWDMALYNGLTSSYGLDAVFDEVADEVLREALTQELMVPFLAMMERMYVSSVSWDRYTTECPIVNILREDVDYLIDTVKAVARKFEGHPYLAQGLRAFIRLIDDFDWQDFPVYRDGRLEWKESILRSDYYTESDVLERPEWVEQMTGVTIDREPILRRERGRLAEAIIQLIVGFGQPEEQKPSIERIEWISSVAAFEHVFSTLAARGYFKLSKKGGKKGEANLKHFSRQLLSLFDVPGEGGRRVTAEQLRVRLSPGAENKLAGVKQKKFQIPQAGELIIPPAEDLE
jgi:hypothetical protein